MILANLYLGDDHKLGLHQFAGIPHRGDRLHIEVDGGVMVLTVERVDHYPAQAKMGGVNIFGSAKPAVTVFCSVVDRG